MSRSNRVYAYADAAAKYGDVVRFQFGPIIFHLVRHPDHIKHVLQENHANYHKGRGLRKMKTFLGEGLLTSEGETWRRARKLSQPAFHRQKLAGLAGTMAEESERMLQRWEAGIAKGTRDLDVHKEMMALTLNVASRTLFSVDVSREADTVGRALNVALEEATRRTFTLWDLPLWFPTPRNTRYREAITELDRIVYGIIRDRRRAPSSSPDLLGLLMDVRDADTGESMNDKQVRDESMTIFLAGHETTANALSWIFYLLSKNPTALRKLEAEVDVVLAGGRAPAFEDLPQLKYTRMVVDESMRLFPPAWIFGRTALEEDNVGGYTIPKGSVVAVSSYLAHRHPDFWSNPEGFDPERFTPEESAGRHKYAYVPFGAGPRVCIGNQFALMEATLLLGHIASRVRLSLLPGVRIEPRASITLRPRASSDPVGSRGMPMTAERRRAVS